MSAFFEINRNDLLNETNIARSIIQNQRNQTPSGSYVPLKTSLSGSEPRAGLTTFAVSELMQGLGTIRPEGIAYDAFNQTLSGDLGYFLDTEGGADKILKGRKNLLAYDIEDKQGLDDGIFSAVNGGPGANSDSVTQPGGEGSPPPAGDYSNQAIPYDEATSCTGGPTPGATALVDHWKRTTGLGSLGIYACRPIRGSSSGYSVHSEGRAADLACNANDAAQKKKGDDYAAWLISNAHKAQIQYIIWNKQSWKPGRGWAAYSGASPHTDHLHVELNKIGAAQASPVFT